jgi:hypothetical protein
MSRVSSSVAVAIPIPAKVTKNNEHSTIAVKNLFFLFIFSFLFHPLSSLFTVIHINYGSGYTNTPCSSRS